jgi:hypothetical protein
MSKESSAKKSEVLDENSGSASHFSIYKGFAQKYKGKYATIFALISYRKVKST